MNSRINIYDGDDNKRFVIGCTGEKTLYAIAMNPSVAETDLFDQTVIKIFGLSYLWNYDCTIMFNLIPIREPDSTKLEETMDINDFNKNIDTISTLPDNATVLATWGDISKSKLLKSSFKKIYDGLKEKNLNWIIPTLSTKKVGSSDYELRGLTQSGHPRHLSFAKQCGSFQKFEIDTYYKSFKF